MSDSSIEQAVRSLPRLEVLIDLGLVPEPQPDDPRVAGGFGRPDAGTVRWELDDIAELAATLCGAPQAAVSVPLPDRLVFAGAYGLPSRTLASPAPQTGCGRVVTAGEPLLLPDVATHPAVSRQPLAVRGLVSAYHGFPVVVDGEVVASLCVFSPARLQLTEQQQARMRTLARHASQYLSMRRRVQTARQHAGSGADDGLPGAAGPELDLTDAPWPAPAEGAERPGHDALTGLLNRTGLLAAGRETLRHVQGPHAMISVDLDRLGVLNDSLGHDAGDVYLRTTAARLRSQVPASHALARVGGDEFVVLCPRTDVTAARTLAGTLAGALCAPITVGATTVPVSASVGVAAVGDTGEDLVADLLRVLRGAERAVRVAKSQGPGQVAVADPSAISAADHASQLELELRRLLARQGGPAPDLTLVYQPQIDLADRRVSGLEVLLRWKRAGHGLVRPEQFIAVAESAGLMPALGEFVLREALRQHARWRAEGSSWADAKIWVNVSGRQLEEPRFADRVATLLDELTVPAGSLGLELTESVVTAQTATSRAQLEALQRAGIRLAIDDFGTGFSNLALLRSAPVDVVKIDKSIVAGLSRSAEGDRLVDAVLGLATALDLEVVAEGVETEEQLAALAERDCSGAQGYLLGLPMDAADLPRVRGLGATAPPGTRRIDLAATSRGRRAAALFTGFETAARAVLRRLREDVGMRVWAVTRKVGADQVLLIVEGPDDAPAGGSVPEGTVVPWEQSLCVRMVRGEAPRVAPRVADEPALAHAGTRLPMPVAAYVGVPLHDQDGDLFGTLCAFDNEPHGEGLRDAEATLELYGRLLSSLLASELMQDELTRRVELAESEAALDPLTGLANRRGWADALAREEARCRRYGHPATVIVVDLDELKQVNDTGGHAAGDDLLRRTAATLRTHVRGSDLVARLGGDEFGVLSVQADPDGGPVAVTRLTGALTAAGIAASAGWAPRDPRGSLAEAWQAADAAMYESKERRRRR